MEFIKGMKYLSSLYLKDIDEKDLGVWYDVFKNVEKEVFYVAVKKIGLESKYFPNAGELFTECKKQRPAYLIQILNSNPNIPNDRKKYLLDMIDWYRIQESYPKEILTEIYSYNQKLNTSEEQLKIGG